MLYKPGIISQKSEEADRFFISGKMTAPVVDLEGDMITRDSYQKTINTVKQRAADNKCVPIFIEHRRKELSLPVGKIIDAWEKEDGLYFKGEIVGGQLGQPIRDLINGGYLYSVSVGGDALSSHKAFDPSINQEIKKITDMEVRELSLTGLPVNPSATFEIAKSLNKDESEVKNLIKKLDKAIDDTKIIKSLDDMDISKAIDPSNLDDSQLQKIKQYLDNLANLLGIQEEGGAATTQQAEGADQTQQQVEPKNVTEEMKETNEDSETKPVEMEQPPKQEENVKENSMVAEDYDTSVSNDELLKKINEKLDKLLSEEEEEELESDEEDNKIIDNEETSDELDENEETNNEEKNEEVNEEEKVELKKKPKMALVKKSLEVNKMEAYVCNKCGNEFEKSMDYEAKFCPSCGDNLEKSIATEDLVCEGCESAFEKSMDYEMSFCPKCGKSLSTFKAAMATGSKATGEKTAYKGTKKEGEKGEVGTAAMATAPKAKGETPSYKGEEAAETGPSVEAYQDGDYIDDAGTNGEVAADGEDEDIKDVRPAGKKLLGKFDESKVKTHGVKKSLESRLEQLEKSLGESQGRRTVVAPQTEEIAKSIEPSEGDIARNFVATLFGH